MTNTYTEIVQTKYGDVEIETVDCDSCGNRVSKEDTVTFEIGSRKGLACEHCEKEGPISFPRLVLKLREFGTDPDRDSILYPLLFPYVYLIVALINDVKNGRDTQFWRGFWWATVVLTTWGGVFTAAGLALF